MNTLHGFAAVTLLSMSMGAQALPNYTAEACCQLCPQAAQATYYEPPELKNYATLVEAKDQWLFRTRSDFRTDFGLDESSSTPSSACATGSPSAGSNWCW